MTLDERLTRAAPPVAARTPELTESLRELVHESEQAARIRRGRRVRAAVAGAAALFVLGVGGAATAGGVLPGWFPWTSDTGSSCGLQASAELRRDGDGALITDRWSELEQRRALASAQSYLASLDLDSIDRAKAADAWFTHLENVSVGDPDRAELEDQFPGQSLEIHAVLYAVDSGLDDYLSAGGYDPDSVMVTVAARCGR